MRVVIISDTHAKKYSLLPEELRADIEKADAVIHAGDIGSEHFYEKLLKKSKKLYAVLGNNDMLPIPFQQVFTLDNVKIALIHGELATGSRENWLLYHFANDKPDLIIFGHTHMPFQLELGSVTLLNPGSPRKGRGLNGNSYVVMETENGRFALKFKRI